MNPSTPQDVLLTRAFQSLAASIAAEGEPPPPHLVWLRALRERRRLAIQRATRPLRMIEALAFLCSLLLVAFLLHQSSPLLLTHTTLELGGLAFAIVVASGCVLLNLARKTSASD